MLRLQQKYYRDQQEISVTTAASAKRLWGRVGNNFDASYQQIRTPLVGLVQAGRAAAAVTAAAYTPRLLSAQGIDAPGVGAISVEGFLATTPDGRSVTGLLDHSTTKTKLAVAGGATSVEARALTSEWLVTMLLTLLADTSRGVMGADIAQREKINGYIRAVSPGSCSRCIILAGKFFRWNSGFLRHPNCHCQHYPTTGLAKAKSDGLIMDPYEVFKGLSEAEQDRRFGRLEARAIREGADIYRVVNLKNRGLATARGATLFGTPARMTIDDIFRVAGTRTNAIKLLTENGYITGPQTVGGNIRGQFFEGFGALGKGGSARAASNAVLDARASGVRDPLNRYTMTAAERRLFDAKTRLDEARRTGNWPQSVGANSADKFTHPRPLRSGELAILEKVLAQEMASLKDAAASVKELARLLGLT